MRDTCGLIQVSSDAPILIVQDVKKNLLSGHCVFFLVLGLNTATQVHAEEKISLFILDDLFVGFHCFPPAPLYTGRSRRGEEERLPFFARRKMIDPRLSPALPSLPRSTPHVTQGSGFLCVGCCWSILFSCIAFLSCPAALLSSLISCSALYVYVLVASGLFQTSSLAKANGSECLQGCAHSVAFSSRNFKVTRSDCTN